MNIKIVSAFILMLALVSGCKNSVQTNKLSLDQEVKAEFIRSWEGYKTYAWGHDVLLPVSGGHKDWYEESLHISPIDAYSTIHFMGLDELAEEVERYIMDSVTWEKDLFVKTFEVNIRILGGMLAMYQYTRDPLILEKTEDFGKRMLSAFNSPTGIPYYWFNLKTGEVKGKRVNIAEAGTYLLEMGILSYYTGNPEYYQAAKKANRAVWERTSELGLVGEIINVETGEWVKTVSHICAGIDSYYEYLLKAYLLFGDEELLPIWERSIASINKWLVEESDTSFWYKRVDMYTGEKIDRPMNPDNPEILEGGIVTLYDAFMPAVLVLHNDLDRAGKTQATWDWLWNRYGLLPMVYDFDRAEPTYPVYGLNPELIESTYYLLDRTGDEKYLEMIQRYWSDIKEYCRTDIAFSSVEDVRTMEKRDDMPTFFFAETMKYFYLAFTIPTGEFKLDDYIFTTEAHPFPKKEFDPELVRQHLGLTR